MYKCSATIVAVKYNFIQIEKSHLITRIITKTRLYNFDPLKPHFYIVNWGLQGYALFFLFLLKNIDCGYSLEMPRRGGSNEYTQTMFWAEIWKISEFLSIFNFQFLVVKFSIYLNRRENPATYRETQPAHGNSS